MIVKTFQIEVISHQLDLNNKMITKWKKVLKRTKLVSLLKRNDP